MKTRAVFLVVALTLVGVGIWSISRRTSVTRATPTARPPVAIQDGKTIDFSSGKAVVRDNQKEEAIINKSVAEMDAAAADVTFKSNKK